MNGDVAHRPRQSQHVKGRASNFGRIFMSSALFRLFFCSYLLFSTLFLLFLALVMVVWRVHMHPSATSTQEGSMMEKIFLTAEEAASLLRLSKWAVYRMLEKQQIPGARKVAGKWRISRRKLVRWIEEAA